eukprot:TRINITY_DN1610_c0_g1_i1.p1 TRINITY_DN1610_c0_g1~~TRINITY_DN1610_c0_g1_i1.p1  ORF type:complete len:596 (-),score=100.72 TRINITY_DN1610_c0_g1_i1:9-1796(-)
MKIENNKILVQRNKWAILLVFPMYWCNWILYDTPSYVSTTLKANLNLNNSQYSYFYLAYTIPNIFILPLVPWIDKTLGRYVTSILANIFMFFSTVIFTLFNNSYVMIIIGRILFGFGGEIAACSSIAFIRTFAAESDFSFFIGLFFASCRIMMSLSSIFFVRIADSTSLSFAFGIIMITTLISLSSCCFACYQNKLIMEDIEQTKKNNEHEVSSLSNTNSNDILSDSDDINKETWFIIVSMFASFGIPLCVCSFFIQVCAQIGIDQTASSSFLSMHAISAFITSILGGFLYDKIGKRGIGHAISVLMLSLCPVALNLGFSPALVIFIQGGFYGLISIQSNGIISICLPSRLHFKALNYYYTFINIGQTAITISFASLSDRTGNFEVSLNFLFGFGFLFFIQMVILHFITDFPINQKNSGYASNINRNSIKDPSIDIMQVNELNEIILVPIAISVESCSEMLSDKGNLNIASSPKLHTEIEYTEFNNSTEILSSSSSNYDLLCLAAFEGDIETIKLLMKETDNEIINLINENGDFPLLCACRGGNIDIVKLLLDNNAEINLVNKNGQGAIDIAIENNHNEVVNVLTAFSHINTLVK